MNQKKTLQELTFKNNFMFGAVLLDPENCKGVIERSIGMEIERVEVSKEKSIVYNPDFKDPFVKRLQNAVREVKASREMGARYMTFQELLKDERKAGRLEGKVEKMRELVEKKLAKGDSAEKIADDLVEEICVIEEIMKMITNSRCG